MRSFKMLARRRLSLKSFYKLLFTVVMLSVFIIYIYSSIKRATQVQIHTAAPKTNGELPNYRVHVFYSGSFRNKELDREYLNWNYNSTESEPVTAYYPQLGLYSSNDGYVIDNHMKLIRQAGIGVVVVFWSNNLDRTPPLGLILVYAQKYQLKVTVCIEDHENRNIINIFEYLHEIFKSYRQHAAFYRTTVHGKSKILPMIYIQNMHVIPVMHWYSRLGYNSEYSIRNTYLDAFFIGAISDEIDKYILFNSGFDGFCTFSTIYNASYGTNWNNWPYIQDFASQESLIFLPTVGPGYENHNTQKVQFNSNLLTYINRNDGAYYRSSWMRAIISRAEFVTINSFNGWIDGTQIEPAKPKTHINNTTLQYKDYEPQDPDCYITATRFWIAKFHERYLMRMVH